MRVRPPGHHAPDPRQLNRLAPSPVGHGAWVRNAQGGADRGDLMAQLVVTSYGDPRESVSLERGPGPLLGPDDILVEMEAAPVNPSRFLLVRGDYGVRPRLPSPAGGEGAGRVIDAGGGAGTGLVGRRVVILPTYEQGTWADKVATSYRNVVPVPEDADPLQLAMLPVNPATAYLMLHKYATLAAGA